MIESTNETICECGSSADCMPAIRSDRSYRDAVSANNIIITYMHSEAAVVYITL